MHNLRLKMSLLCVSLLTPSAMSAATYYVSPQGNDSSLGTSTTTAWKTIAHVNSASLGQGDQVLFLRGGTWREALLPQVSGLYYGAYGTGARPVISGADIISSGWTSSGNNVWKATVGGWDLTQIWLNGARGTPVSSVAAILAPGQWFWDGNVLYLYSTANPATAFTSPGVEITRRVDALELDNVGAITVEHLAFVNSMYVNIYLASGVTGTQTFNDVVWQGALNEGFKVDSGTPHITSSEGLYNGEGIGIGGGGGLTMSNSILSGNRAGALEMYGTSGSSTIDSSTISVNATDSVQQEIISNWSSWPLTVTNSILLANPFLSKQYTFTGVTDAGSNAYTSPQFTTRGAPLIVIPYIDDYNNLSVAESVASTAATYGCHLSYAVNTKLITPADWTRISNLKNAGNEIVAHTRSHPDLANTNVVTIGYSGTASTATMTINTGTGKLQTFLGGSATPDLNIDISDSYNSVLNVCSQVTARSGYSCTPQDNQNYFTPLLLANVSNVDIKTPYVAAAASNYLNWEVEGSQTDIQTNLPGYTVTAFATPFTSSNTTVENHIRDAGFASNRNGTITGTGAPNGNWLFNGLNLYDIAAQWFPDDYDSTKPAGSVAALVEGLGAKGGIAAVYSHGYDEFTLAQWQQFFQNLQQMGGTCMTISQAIAYVKANGTLVPDGTNKTWTRLISPTPNFTNTSSSPTQGAHGLQ